MAVKIVPAIYGKTVGTITSYSYLRGILSSAEGGENEETTWSGSRRKARWIIMHVMRQFRSIVLFALLTGGLSPIYGANPPSSPDGLYQGFGYEWENNDLGMDHRVPAPWTPVKVNEKVLEIWGRNYIFGETLFPRQITSQGRRTCSRCRRR